MPERIQLSRAKGWRKPENTVVVSRPSKWGNPFAVGQHTHLWHRSGAAPYGFYRDTFKVERADQAVSLYRSLLTNPEVWRDEAHIWPLAELRGKNLACWCAIGRPCHADVLLELANGDSLPCQ